MWLSRKTHFISDNDFKDRLVRCVTRSLRILIYRQSCSTFLENALDTGRRRLLIYEIRQERGLKVMPTDTKCTVDIWAKAESAQNCRLRSANRGNSYNDWNVNGSTGAVNNNNAINANRCAPDCYSRCQHHSTRNAEWYQRSRKELKPSRKAYSCVMMPGTYEPDWL